MYSSTDMDGLRSTVLFLIVMNGFDSIFLMVMARDALHDRRLLKRLMMRTSGEDVNSLRLIVVASMMWNARHR
jgi:hypothetical protein